jgi:hypothetical protein
MGFEKQVALVIEDVDPSLNDAYYFEDGTLYVEDLERGKEVHDILRDSRKFGQVTIDLTGDRGDRIALLFCTECLK